MIMAPNSYLPATKISHSETPWCAECDTDLHLVIESPAVPGRLAGSLAVAVHCSKCRQSRVLDTTEELLAALPVLAAKQGNLVHRDTGYFHCGEPMVSRAGDWRPRRTFPCPGPAGPGDSLAACLATKVLRCRCGFQMELPR